MHILDCKSHRAKAEALTFAVVPNQPLIAWGVGRGDIVRVFKPNM
jgi:hypothetical protein